MIKTLNITLPILSLNDVKLSTAGIRPFRTGGIRLEEQILKNKKVFHNYGHGGAGVSLSYGCASQTIKIFLEKYSSTLPLDIAVLGSGYMGLFTAKILAEKGFKVKLYSKQIPYVNERGQCEIASEAAAGLWLPYGYDLNEANKQQTDLHDIASKLTFDFFTDSMIHKRYTGIKEITCVFFNSDPQVTFKKFIPQTINMNYQTQSVIINQGSPISCQTMSSLIIEGFIFLKELIQECETLGVRFEKQAFENHQQVLNLKEDGAKIFGDNNMVPIKGQIVYCNAFKDFNYYINFINQRGENVTTYPHQQYTGIGLTKEIANNTIPTIESTIQLIKNYNQMVTDHSVKQNTIYQEGHDFESKNLKTTRVEYSVPIVPKL